MLFMIYHYFHTLTIQQCIIEKNSHIKINVHFLTQQVIHSQLILQSRVHHKNLPKVFVYIPVFAANKHSISFIGKSNCSLWISQRTVIRRVKWKLNISLLKSKGRKSTFCYFSGMCAIEVHPSHDSQLFKPVEWFSSIRRVRILLLFIKSWCSKIPTLVQNKFITVQKGHRSHKAKPRIVNI